MANVRVRTHPERPVRTPCSSSSCFPHCLQQSSETACQTQSSGLDLMSPGGVNPSSSQLGGDRGLGRGWNVVQRSWVVGDVPLWRMLELSPWHFVITSQLPTGSERFFSRTHSLQWCPSHPRLKSPWTETPDTRSRSTSSFLMGWSYRRYLSHMELRQTHSGSPEF